MSNPWRPKLGQHFLRDQRYRFLIVQSLDLLPGDLVVEIGAGRGEMTELLADRSRSVIAVELDAALATRLQEKCRDHPRVKVLSADILSVNLSELCREAGTEQCFIFGNLPYYITSPILRHLFSFVDRIRGMGLLIQHEVANRLTALPASRDYGYLTILARLYSEPRIALVVSPQAFSPPPKVRSALVNFKMRPNFLAWKQEDKKEFLRFVGGGFRQKRKILLNNLSSFYRRSRVEQEMLAMNVPGNIRAEQLTIDQLVDLFLRLRQRQSGEHPT